MEAALTRLRWREVFHLTHFEMCQMLQAKLLNVNDELISRPHLFDSYAPGELICSRLDPHQKLCSNKQLHLMKTSPGVITAAWVPDKEKQQFKLMLVLCKKPCKVMHFSLSDQERCYYWGTKPR